MVFSLLLPGWMASWVERRRALKELQQMTAQADWQLALNDNNPINLAKSALSLNDREAALSHYEYAVTRHRSFVRDYHDSLEVMLLLRRYTEAELLMKEGMALKPGERHYAGGYASVAESQGSYQEALVRWKAVGKKFPGWWKPHVHVGICMRHIGNLDESELALREAVEAFPDSKLARIEWARSAEARQDWPEAIRRWQDVWQFSRHQLADIGIGRALEEIGQLDAAEQHFLQARMRWPLIEELWIGLARIAYKRGQLEESLSRWRSVKERLPMLRHGYEGELRLLREMGRFVEAEAVALEAKNKFPRETWPTTEQAITVREREARRQETK